MPLRAMPDALPLFLMPRQLRRRYDADASSAGGAPARQRAASIRQPRDSRSDVADLIATRHYATDRHDTTQLHARHVNTWMLMPPCLSNTITRYLCC